MHNQTGTMLERAGVESSFTMKKLKGSEQILQTNVSTFVKQTPTSQTDQQGFLLLTNVVC
jgi:hypothetical protein